MAEQQQQIQIRIIDLHEIHGTDETWNMYQIFLSEGGRVKSSMVLGKNELRDLYQGLQEIFTK